MTGPFAFLDNKPEQTTPSPFDFLDQKKDEGAFSYLGNLAHNFGLAIAAQGYNSNDPVITPMADMMFRNNPQERAQIQAMQEQLKAANMKGGDTWNVLKDKLQPSNLYNSFKDSVGNLFNNGVGGVGDMVGGLAKGLVQAPGSILEAGTGLNLGDDIATAMTPEERAQKTKDAAAVLVTGAVTATARFAMLKGLKSLAESGTAGATADVAANAIQKGGKLGLLGKQLVRSGSLGLAEGAIGGGTYGAVSGLGDEDQVSKIISGMLFAPIGMVAEMIGAKVKGGDEISKIQENAGKLFNLRQLQYSPDMSLNDVMKNMESIATSDDLAKAVLKGKMQLGNSHIVIPNIQEELTKPFSNFVENSIKDLDSKQNDYYTSWHKEADGTHTLLIGPRDLGTDAGITFAKTGYLPNEVVSYKGKDYLFNKGLQPFSSGETLFELKDPVTQKTIPAFANEITRNSEFNLDNGTVTINSPLTLKGKLLAVNKNITSNPYGGYNGEIINPYASQNSLALENIQTGSPTTFIGIRQSRGQQIIGNGKFYALAPEHLLGYTPSKYEGYSADIVNNKDTGPFKLGITSTAPGRQTIPGILDNNLSVNRLTFNNPFVFDGKHYSFSKDVANFYKKYVTSPSAPPWALKDLAKSGAMSDAGVTWGSIFTEKEMAGIAEARNIEQKPIGMPTVKYMASKNPSPIELKLNNVITEMETAQKKYGATSPEYLSIKEKYENLWKGEADYGNNIRPEQEFPAGKTHSESHYAIIDRIVAGAMKRNGYDGFIYRSGGIHNSEIVDINERGVFNRKDQTVPVTGKASNILDSQKFVDNLYNEFKQNNWLNDFDSQDKVQNVPVPFDQAFENFAKNKGFLPEEIPNLRRSFEQRIHSEILDNLPAEEKTLYTRLQNEITNKQTETFNNTSNSLKESAVRNGMYFDQADAGVINLRDTESNKSLGTFHSVKDAQDFINKSGQAKGIDLDGNSTIPPIASGGNLPDNLGPQNPPATNISWLDKAQALTFSRLQWLTPNPSLFKNWDTQFGTTLFANVFDPIEAAYRKYEGAFNNNVIIPLRNIKAPFIKAGLNKADAETISHYLQTTSIDEFMQNGEYGKKPLTPLDIAAAHQLKGADLTAAMDYKHALRDVDPNDSKTINLLKQQFNITSNEENALNVIDAISKQPKELGTIYSSVKLARLLQNPELALTRADFAKKFNMNQVQLQAASALDAFYKKQADIAGIPEEGRLANYMTHARLYEKGNIGNTLTQLANSEKEKQFYAGMIRTGELSAYELDPFAAALRYGNALNRSIHLSPVISDAVKALREQVSNGVPKGAGDKVLRDANTFLNDVQQRRAIGDNYANAAVDAFHGYLGAMPDANVRTTWVNTINKYITAAAQAGRPFVGIRNFWQNGSMYFTKWGLDETRKVFSLGAHADLDSMKRDGLIQSYSPVGLGSAVDEDEGLLERVGSKLRTGLDKSTDFGMKLSGQQAVNERFAAGAFLNTRSNVAKMSRDLIAKKFGDNFEDPNTFQKAYHTLQLERYSDPVKVQFDKLIKSNKFDDAANFLANANIQETWGTYGNANAPSGWNNNLGRLVGKFGSWSVNHRDYIVSLASRGTRAQKLQALGRMALTEGSVAAAATTLGVNLSGFYSLPALMFNGGPTTGLVSTAMNALFGRGQAQNDAISKVQKLLPYNFQKDEFQRSILVPFSFGVGDLVDGLDMASNGDVAGGLMKIGGISPQSSKYKGSDFEENVGETIGAK